MHRRAYVTWRAAGLSQRDGHRPLIDSPRLDELPRVLLFPPRLPSSETRRRNRRSKLGGGAGGGERGGEGSLSLDKAKRWTSCQVTRNSSKQESIPSEIHTYTFPTESIQRIRPPRPFLPRHFEKAAARVGGKHASPATFGLRKLRWPLLRTREEREEVSVHCFYQPRSNAEETEVWATVAEETVAKFETRGFAPARDFRISDVGILTSAGRGGDSRHVATGGTREKERDEGRGEVSAIVWRLINLG